MSLSRLVAPLALWLALALLTPAHAEILVVPTGPLLGDGRTTATVQLYLPDRVTGEKYKLKPDDGRAGQVLVAPDGLLSFSWTPPRIARPQVVGFSLQRKGGPVEEERFEVALVPPWDGELRIEFDPPELLAGSGTALVRVTPAADTPQAGEARRFLLSASIGELAAAMPAGDGTWVARYTPPVKVDGPRTVIVAAADAAAPDQIFGWAALPIRVKRSVSVSVEPDANTILTVGSKQYGPLQASPAGTVAFEVELDPRLPTGSVQAVHPLKGTANLQIELPQPDYSRLGFVPLPAGIPADPVHVDLPIRIVATDLTGQPLRASIPSLHASVGQLSTVETSPIPGVYEAHYTPPSDPGAVVFSAEAEGSSISATVQLLPPMTRLTLSAEPSELPAKVRDFTITARVQDPGGASVAGRQPELDVKGATVFKKMKDNGDGTYSGVWRLDTDANAATILGVPPLKPSGLPPYRLLIWPRQAACPADGKATLPVSIAALDRFGLPVPGVDIKLAVPRGDAALPANTRTNAQGLIMADLRAGQTPGLVTLRAEAAGLVAEAPLFQVASGQVAPAAQPAGDPEGLTALSLWRSAVTTLAVAREGAAPLAGPPAMVTVATVPPFTTPGAAILVSVQVADAMGVPLPGVKLQVLSSLGTVGALTDNKDGSYNLPVQLPPGQDGPLTLTVTAGEVSRPLLLPTLVQAGAQPVAVAQGQGSGPTTGPAPAAGRAPTQPRQVSEVPIARLYGGLSLLGHDYTMEGSGEGTTPAEASYVNGNLFKGKVGGAPSLLAGGIVRLGKAPVMLEAEGSAWLETVAVAGDEYDNTGLQARIGARYYAPIGTSPVYWYAMGGYLRTPALAFIYGDETRTSVDLQNHTLNGVRLGGGLGVEAGRFWGEFDASLTWGLYALPQVYAPRLMLGVDVKPGLMVFLTYAYEARNVRVKLGGGDGILHVRDTYQPIVLGIGGAFG